MVSSGSQRTEQACNVCIDSYTKSCTMAFVREKKQKRLITFSRSPSLAIFICITRRKEKERPHRLPQIITQNKRKPIHHKPAESSIPTKTRTADKPNQISPSLTCASKSLFTVRFCQPSTFSITRPFSLAKCKRQMKPYEVEMSASWVLG